MRRWFLTKPTFVIRYYTLSSTRSSVFLNVNQEVKEALKVNAPVVALESTIVAHGMPFPQNLELAHKVESILRSKGVIPATIAIKNAVCRVGLDADELEDLAQAGQEGRANKCSTRELSLFLATQQQQQGSDHKHHPQHTSKVTWGATTVASTMVLAHLAGITTFVTGGIGGVHRNAEVSMDVSADLLELSRTPVVVVSAGIKSILDIRKTLEVLETNGVPTVVYQSNEFPAFFSPHSGLAAPARMDDPNVIAAAYWAARGLKLPHGMLVAVPNFHPAGESVERAIQEALTEAYQQSIQGQAVTPFLLKRVADKTGGDSLRSNMALVQQNAIVGADIAVAISKQRDARKTPGTNLLSSKIVVVGGIVQDMVARPTSGNKLILGTSNPGQCSESDGGVGRNVAEALGRLGSQPLLYSAVGNDDRGRALLERLRNDCGVVGTDNSVRIVHDKNTATFVALLNDAGDLHTACADMAVMAGIEQPSDDVLKQAQIVVFDANPPLQILRETAQRAVSFGAKIAFEPTSVPKAKAVAQDSAFLSSLTYTFPNYDELVAMVTGEEADTSPIERHTDFVQALAQKLLTKMREDAYVVVTLGDKGAMLCSRSRNSEAQFKHFPAQQGVEVRNTTGAGDSLCAGFLHALLNGYDEDDALILGMRAAVLSLNCAERTIAPNLVDIL